VLSRFLVAGCIVFFHHSNPSADTISRLITPQIESTLFPCFSPSVTSKKTEKTNRVNGRFLVFLLRLRKKQKKKQTESTTASLFFSFCYSKKTETKKENEGERIRLFHPDRF
jgi:hypothetical protein